MEHIAISGPGAPQIDLFRELEFRKITKFLTENRLVEECSQKQLRALWTAYCLHNNLDVDTSEYDKDMMSLWERMYEGCMGEIPWADYNAFDLFMGALLS